MCEFMKIMEDDLDNCYSLIDLKNAANPNDNVYDFGRAVIANGLIAINGILKLSGKETLDFTKFLICDPVCSCKDKERANTLEELVYSTKEWSNLDYTNIIQKFKSIASEVPDLPDYIAKLSFDDIEPITKKYFKYVDKLIIKTSDLEKIGVFNAGYVWSTNLPLEQINDAMHYAKDAIINIIKDTSKDIWDIITGANINDSKKNMLPKGTEQNSAFVTQPLPQPLVMTNSMYSPVPNYTGNKDIMKHFVIGNNVVIYDPYVQQSFEKDLVDLSKALDKVDKELGLKQPSRFGFEKFISPLDFKLVRVNKDGKFIDSSDSDNYIAVWTEESSLYITKSNKATA